MISIEDLSKLGGITDRDEMIKACESIPSEDLRLALVLTALAYNTSAKSHDENLRKKGQEISRLKNEIEKLRIELRNK